MSSQNNGWSAESITHKWGMLMIVPFFAFFCCWSWRKWPDILIDFGRELYIPWQLSCGKVLFRDVEHLFGPFSAYFNTACFQIFGISYMVLLIVDLAIAMIFLWLIHRLFSRCSGLLALFCGLIVIPLFLFAHNSFNGNYNFISPYTHDITHGIVLAVTALLLLQSYHELPRHRLLLLAGLVTGLVFLTKIEIFVALLTAEAAFFLLSHFLHKNDMRSMALFVEAALMPPLIFFGYFLTVMPFPQALRGVTGQWITLLENNPSANPLYRYIMGTDQLWVNLSDMVSYAAIFMVGTGLSYWFCLRMVKTGRLYFLLGLSAILLFNGWAVCSNFPKLACAFPILTLVAILVLAHDFFRRKNNINQGMMLLVWSIFSLFLLFKIFFKCKFNHYGFALTLPATLLIISMLLYVLPERLKATNGNVMLFRTGMTVIIGVIILRSIMLTGHFYEIKSYPVGNDGDRIYTEKSQVSPRGMVVAGAVDWLKLNVKPNETVAVLPEGIMLNYLSRRSSSCRYTNFLPFEMSIYGENQILRELEANPPDFCVIVHRTIREYGGGLWGRTKHGIKLMDWLNRDYQPVAVIGFEPFQEEAAFGIKIMVAKNRKSQIFKPINLRQQ